VSKISFHGKKEVLFIIIKKVYFILLHRFTNRCLVAACSEYFVEGREAQRAYLSV
jgi:hypothetical protein